MLYPITPLNGAPRVTVHAPLSGYRCMHRYAGHFLEKFYCYCKVSNANDGRKTHFFDEKCVCFKHLLLFWTLFDPLNHSSMPKSRQIWYLPICNIVITKTITTKQFYTGTSISNQQENIYKHSYKTTNQDTEEMTKHLIIIYL
jgi:hypothetical protein